MNTATVIKCNRATQRKRLRRTVKLLRERIDRLGKELEELRWRTEGQMYRLANRTVRLERVIPAGQLGNGT